MEMPLFNDYVINLIVSVIVEFNFETCVYHFQIELMLQNLDTQNFW